MKGPPLGPAGEDITWPDQVAPRGRKAPSTRKVKTSNLKPQLAPTPPPQNVQRTHGGPTYGVCVTHARGEG